VLYHKTRVATLLSRLSGNAGLARFASSNEQQRVLTRNSSRGTTAGWEPGAVERTAVDLLSGYSCI